MDIKEIEQELDYIRVQLATMRGKYVILRRGYLRRRRAELYAELDGTRKDTDKKNVASEPAQ